MSTIKEHIPLLLVILIIGGAIYYLQSQKVEVTGGDVEDAEISVLERLAVRQDVIKEKERKYETAKEITSPDGFINTEPITVQELVGKKVILIDFWTYSCINCQRTLPYLNSWYQKYSDKGLEIIGVHTPEFKFEEDYDNVLAAVEKFNVKHPVVLDNDYSTWRSYENRYWPRKYIIDIDGFIVYDHIGEGAYEETEKVIQKLLKERNEVLGLRQEIDEAVATPDNVDEVDFSQVGSPEIYFGPWRNDQLANGKKRTNGVQELTIPETITKNALYLGGIWEFDDETAENKSKDARIVFTYEAKKVNFVAEASMPIPIEVFQDGELVKTVTIEDPGLYTLIENERYGEHRLLIKIKEPGVKAFTFTFG